MMKIVKKISVLLMTVLLMTISVSPVAAMEAAEDEKTYFFLERDGQTLEFVTQEDYDKYIVYLEKLEKSPSKSLRYTNTVRVPIFSETLSYRHVGYNNETPDWSYATKYTISSGKTYKGSASAVYEGFTFSVGVSKTVSVSIELSANGNASKLGFMGNPIVSRSRYDVYDSGTFVTSYYANAMIVTNLTNYVAYRGW